MTQSPENREGERAPSDDHLWDYLAVILRHRNLALAIFLVATGAATIRTLMTRPVYLATAQLLIEPENPNVLSFKEVADAQGGRDDYYQTQYKLLQSRSLVRRVVEGLNLLQDPEFGGPRAPETVEAAHAAAPGTSGLMEGAISSLLGHLRVTAVKNSRLVAVGCEAFRPELASTIANKLSQLYILQTLEFRFRTSSEAGQWLGDQVDEQRKKAELAAQELQKLKEREGIVNIEERRTLLDQKLNQLGAALTTARTTRIGKESLYFQMRSAPRPEDLPDAVRDPVVQQLRSEIADMEAKQAQLLENTSTSTPRS